MYDSDELLKELQNVTLFEQFSLSSGKVDGLKSSDSPELIDYVYNNNNIRELTQQYYFKNGRGITYAKHPRFTYVETHCHNFFEMAYAYKGDFIQTINGSQMEIREGGLLLLDTNVLHGMDPVDENTYIINILMTREYFSEKLIKQFSNNNLITEFIISAIYKNGLHGNYLYFPLENNSEIRHYIEAVVLEILHDNPGSDEMINSFMMILFTTLTREKNFLNAQKSGSKSTPSCVVNILDYISRNYMNLTLDTAAKEFHFSPNYLSRLLKNYTGKTFITLVLEFKLEKSVTLLEHTDFSITRVAAASGFHNMNYFYRIFENKYQCTPKEYRKKLNEPQIS